MYIAFPARTSLHNTPDMIVGVLFEFRGAGYREGAKVIIANKAEEGTFWLVINERIHACSLPVQYSVQQR